MTGVRSMVVGDSGFPHPILPGEVEFGGENILAGALSTAGSGTWTAAMIASGIIYRTGPTGSYTDTTDTAANILAALAGNSPNSDVVPGSTFRVLNIVTVAEAMTLAYGAGCVAGTGTLTNAGSLARLYLFTILSTCPSYTFQMTGNSGQKNLYFGYGVGTSGAAPTVTVTKTLQASSTDGVRDLVGATVTGTNIGAAAVVNGLIEGVGGIIGVSVTVSNSGAVNGAITFGPTIQIDSLGTLGL